MAVPSTTCTPSCTPVYCVDKIPVSRAAKIAYEILEGTSTVIFAGALVATFVVSYSYAWGLLLAFAISELAKRIIQISTPPICPHAKLNPDLKA